MMKKLLLLCLLIVLCAVLILPVSAAQTSGSCGENLTWKIEGGVLTITGTGPMTEFGHDVLPEWMDLRMDITEIVIGEGVTTIGGVSFQHFENLTKLTLPSTLRTIGNTVFQSCKSLATVKIPDGVTRIGSFAFVNCTALEEIVIPAGTEVHPEAFSGCTSLKKVTFKGNAMIMPEVFVGCTALKDIYFLGDAPVFMDSFTEVTATAYYPAGNATWTADVRQNYGGTITWQATGGCNHTEVADPAVPATCTKTGLTAGKHCSVCGEVLVAQQTVPKTAHKFGAWTQTKAPTTQEVGKEQRKCSSCSKTEERDIPKLQETPTEPPTQPPTTPPTQPPTEGQTESPTTPATDPAPTVAPTEPTPTQPGDGGEELPKTDMVIILVAGLVVLAAAGGTVWLLITRKRK